MSSQRMCQPAGLLLSLSPSVTLPPIQTQELHSLRSQLEAKSDELRIKERALEFLERQTQELQQQVRGEGERGGWSKEAEGEHQGAGKGGRDLEYLERQTQELQQQVSREGQGTRAGTIEGEGGVKHSCLKVLQQLRRPPHLTPYTITHFPQSELRDGLPTSLRSSTASSSTACTACSSTGHVWSGTHPLT